MKSFFNGVRMVGASEHSMSYVRPQTWTKHSYALV